MSDRGIVIVYGDAFSDQSPRARRLAAERVLASAGVKPSLWYRIKRLFRQ